MGNVGNAALSYNDDNPKAPFKFVGNVVDELGTSGEDGVNIDDNDMASMGYDLNGRLPPGVVGDRGSCLSPLVSGFEIGESLNEVGIGPKTGLMADVGGAEVSLSLPSETSGRLGED